MRFRQTHFFNMVEVALALLVISLGLSTVLTLFPAGLKATREAEAANDLAEAADYIFSYLQSDMSKIGIASDDAGKSAETEIGTSVLRIEKKTGNYYIYRKTLSVNSAYVDEFSCIVRISRAADGTSPDSNSTVFAYFPDLASTSLINETSDYSNPQEYHFSAQSNDATDYSAYDVELSYPANVKYDARIKRTFRMVFWKD